MNRNKIHNMLLIVLLLVPGQVFCAEQPSYSKDILSRMWFSMPVAPEWMTNLTTNISGGFANLSDRTKYLIYGAAAAFLTYIGWYTLRGKSSSGSIFTKIPTSMENRDFWNPNYEKLNSTANCSNIAYIVRWYNTVKGDALRETAFKHYVCPVLKAHENELDSQEKWNQFLIDVHKNAHEMTMGPNIGSSGLNMFQLIKKTCPNETITKPLKEFLLPKADKEALKILNQ